MSPFEQYVKICTLTGDVYEYSDLYLNPRYVLYFAISSNNLAVVQSILQQVKNDNDSTFINPLHFTHAFELLPTTKLICDALLDPTIPLMIFAQSRNKLSNIAGSSLAILPWENDAFWQYFTLDKHNYVHNRKHPLLRKRQVGIDYPTLTIGEHKISTKLFASIALNLTIPKNKIKAKNINRLRDWALVEIAPQSLQSLGTPVMDRAIYLYFDDITPSLVLRAEQMYQMLATIVVPEAINYHLYMCQLAILTNRSYTIFYPDWDSIKLRTLAGVVGNSKLEPYLNIVTHTYIYTSSQVIYDIPYSISSRQYSPVIYAIMYQNVLLEYADLMYQKKLLYPLVTKDVAEFAQLVSTSKDEISYLDTFYYIINKYGPISLKLSDKLRQYLEITGR